VGASRHGRALADRHCKEGYFKEAHQEAKRRNIPMQTHACQAVVEFYEMVHRHGRRHRMARFDGVAGPDLVIGHGIFLRRPSADSIIPRNDSKMLKDWARRCGIARPCSRRRGMALNTIGRYNDGRHHRRHRHDTFPATQHGR